LPLHITNLGRPGGCLSIFGRPQFIIATLTVDSSMEGDMLVLTRRIGESIQIGDLIEVHILSVEGNQIRVGVDAPKDVLVLRSELAGQGEPSLPFKGD
jgi:carbon storage regulator